MQRARYVSPDIDDGPIEVADDEATVAEPAPVLSIELARAARMHAEARVIEARARAAQIRATMTDARSLRYSDRIVREAEHAARLAADALFDAMEAEEAREGTEA